jgi:hypothetical protein
MRYAHAKVIKLLEDGDRKARVNILERNDGLFEFRAYEERNDDGPYASGPYWSPTLYSGLYLNAEEAERDALAQLNWQRSAT